MSLFNDEFEGESIPPNANQKAYIVKFIIVGDSGVGKSQIIIRFVHDKFDNAMVLH